MDAFGLGAAVRAARKEKRMTQAELAALTGVSRHTIMQLESATYGDLGIRKVLSVLTVLGLSVSVGPASTRRPTLEEMYATNAQEKSNREAALRRHRARV